MERFLVTFVVNYSSDEKNMLIIVAKQLFVVKYQLYTGAYYRYQHIITTISLPLYLSVSEKSLLVC